MTRKGQKLAELRRSNEAGPMKDRRLKRLQTRQAKKQQAIKEES